MEAGEMRSSMAWCVTNFFPSTTTLSTTAIMAMKPPKLVQAMRKKIQNSEDREISGTAESEDGRVACIHIPVATRPLYGARRGGGNPETTRGSVPPRAA